LHRTWCFAIFPWKANDGKDGCEKRYQNDYWQTNKVLVKNIKNFHIFKKF
jgi:hypothetical protein